MGTTRCRCQSRGKQWIAFECTGKGTQDIWTYVDVKLKVSLVKAIKKMGITMEEINQVLYSYNELDIDKNVTELGIPDGGVVLIKLKSTF